MTIHFAAARPPRSLRALHAPRVRIGGAANDNAVPGHSAELRAALKHFAQHGVGAARVAQENAEAAFFRGDRRDYLHWLTICRTLDRRMARALERAATGGFE